jgi:hypothetical protein
MVQRPEISAVVPDCVETTADCCLRFTTTVAQRFGCPDGRYMSPMWGRIKECSAASRRSSWFHPDRSSTSSRLRRLVKMTSAALPCRGTPQSSAPDPRRWYVVRTVGAARNAGRARAGRRDRNQTNHDMGTAMTMASGRSSSRGSAPKQRYGFPRPWPLGSCRRYSVQPCQVARRPRTAARSPAASTTRVRSWTTPRNPTTSQTHGLVRGRAAQCRGTRLPAPRPIGRRRHVGDGDLRAARQGLYAAAPFGS